MNRGAMTQTDPAAFLQAADAGRVDTDGALGYFDSLDPVSTEFMLGGWRGSGVATGHPMDGVLEEASWYGKRFVSTESVYPLVHITPGGQTFNVQPALMPIGYLVRYPFLKRLLNKRLFLLARPLFSTRHPGARLRMTEYRGVISATMIYDRQPINDVFRKMDENAVLGLMDMRGMQRPFFFRLWREAPR